MPASPGAIPAAPRAKRAPTVADEYQSAPNLKAFFDKYQAGWRNAPAETQAFLLRALETCWSFIEKKPPMLPDDARGAPNHDERVAALERIKALCKGFEGYPVPDSMVNDLTQGSRTGDDPVAKARRLPELMRTDASGQADVAAQSLLKGPLSYEVVNALGDYFSWKSRDERARDPTPLPTQALYRDAWKLVLCDYGGGCAAASPEMTTRCWQQGICAANLEQLIAGQYSPAEYEELMRMRDQIGTGLALRDFDSLSKPRRR
jgi:hypothetical protein